MFGTGIAANTARGADLLDDRLPGWAEQIALLGNLRMGSDDRCVLGLLFGSYEEGMATLFRKQGWRRRGNLRRDRKRHEAAVRYGFSLRGGTIDEWNLLDKRWAEEVRERAMSA